MIKAETKEDKICIDFIGNGEELVEEMKSLLENFIIKILQEDVDEFIDEFAKEWIEFRQGKKEAGKDETDMH